VVALKNTNGAMQDFGEEKTLTKANGFSECRNALS